MDESVVSIQRDTNHHHGRQVETESSQCLDDFASDIPSFPFDSDAPEDLDVNCDEDHHEIGNGQMFDEVVHFGLVLWQE